MLYYQLFSFFPYKKLFPYGLFSFEFRGKNLCKHSSSLQMSVESIKCSQAMWVFPSQYKKETTLSVGKQTQKPLYVLPNSPFFSKTDRRWYSYGWRVGGWHVLPWENSIHYCIKTLPLQCAEIFPPSFGKSFGKCCECWLGFISKNSL